MTNRKARLIGFALVAASVAALSAAVAGMTQRLREHNRATAAQPWWLMRAQQATIDYAGRSLRIEPVADDAGATRAVRVVWGDATAELPAGGRVVEEIPDLKRYEEWLAVLRMASGGTVEAVEAGIARGEIEPRVLIVARQPAAGYDPETWGQARYKDWRYTFLALREDGSIERSDATYGELDDEPRSWRFAAAMQVTPGLFTPGMRSSSPLTYPNYGPIREAFRAMGWTWSVSGVAALALIAGGMLLASSYVRKPGRAEGAAGEVGAHGGGAHSGGGDTERLG